MTKVKDTGPHCIVSVLSQCVNISPRPAAHIALICRDSADQP